MANHTLAIDIETYSDRSLKECGVYKYADSPDFEILLIAYKLDGAPTMLIDYEAITATGPDPDDLELMDYFTGLLTNPDYLKTAFNAPFEIACLCKAFGIPHLPEQWECTMAKSYQCGMSGTLDDIAQILRLEGKLNEGRSLIRYFCVPCKPTKVNGFRTRNLPRHDPVKWELFGKYCVRDVDVECSIRNKLSFFKPLPIERDVWILDQRINRKGVRIDRQLVENAIHIDTVNQGRIMREISAITGISNPKSLPQLKKWIFEESDEEMQIDSLAKEKIPGLLANCNDETIKEVLNLKAGLVKSSVAKYYKMLNYVTPDDCVRGLYQYAGAQRTMRWAGRGIQVHNLPKNDRKLFAHLDEARRLVKEGDYETLDMVFDNQAFVLSQLIRTAFIPSEGRDFFVSDFSSIEAVILAWLAREEWRLKVFRGHGKIYEASASAMFGVPIELCGKGTEYRDKGKIAELALGYQGSVGAMVVMGALRMGLKESELAGIVSRWRLSNPAITQFWYDVGACAIQAVENPGDKITFGRLKFQVKGHVLYITLPSGRSLCYLRPRMQEGKYGMGLTYEGTDSKMGKRKWGRLETYGGKLVENIVQGTARDILAEAMLRVDTYGYSIVLHTHDEVVTDELDQGVPGIDTLKQLNSLMTVLPEWASDLPLGAAGFKTKYYKKED